MECILPQTISDIIIKSKDVEKDLFEFMFSEYSEYLLNKQINIVGVIHSKVDVKFSFTVINWTVANNQIQVTPLKLFFFENLCPKAIRQYTIGNILR
jgi:hypothetical protein